MLSACGCATDPLSFGLRTFAYTFKVADGLGSDEHPAVIQPTLLELNSLGYGAVVGLASLKDVMCVAFEADDSPTIDARTKLYSASDLAFVCKDVAINQICIAQ